MKRFKSLKLALAAAACLSVFSFAAIPEIRITTQNNQEPTTVKGSNCSSCKYVKITNFALTDPNNSKNNLTLTPEPQGESDSIRVRGNSTSDADKKPYRIKFDKEQALFGKPKANSWVLLANYYDHTFALNAIAFRLGQKLGLEFTPSSQHVVLYINNNKKGVYQLTEQIQAKKSRVNVDKDNGFLVEFDYHDADADEIKFSAAQYNLGTFVKSPEVEGCDANPRQNCNIDNAKVKWVQDTINALMNKMAESGFPTSGYRNMIDLKSFAKYVLIQQFMDNFDFNSKIQGGGLPGSNYAYKKIQGEKMQAGPLWDFDLSAVPVQGMGFGQRFSTYQEPIRPKHAFYQRLWADPEFLSEFKAAWEAHKSDFSAIPAFVDSISNALAGSVADNVSADPSDLLGMGSMGGWGGPGGWGGGGGQQYTLTAKVHSQEITKLKTWWGNRTTFFNTEVNKLSAPSISSSSGGGGTSSSSNANSAPLTCSDLKSSVEKGSIINTPTLTCSNGSTPSNIQWGGAPTSTGGWNQEINGWRVAENTGSTEYHIQVTATCGNASRLNVQCGRIDVVEAGSTPIVRQQIASGNGILAVKNGVNLQVQKNARMDIYSLSGKLEKSMNFTNGVYLVSLSDLPKGLYIANVSFGSEKRILRVLVR